MRQTTYFCSAALLAGLLGFLQVNCANPPALEEGSGGSGGGVGTGGSNSSGGGGRGGSSVAGNGGSSGSSAAGTGGSGRSDAGLGVDGSTTRSMNCTTTAEVSVGSFSRVATSFDPGLLAIYAAPIMSPQLGADAPDQLSLEFFQVNDPSLPLNGGMTGVFNLVNDSVPQTCSRCVRIIVDGGLNEFLAQSGTLVVNQGSPVDGMLDATLADVTLSMISGQPLAGVSCLHIASMPVQVKM